MSDFDTFYEQFEKELLPPLNELQKQINAKNTQQLMLIGVVLTSAAFLFVSVAMNLLEVWLAVVILILVVAGAIWFVYMLADRSKIKHDYKRLVMSKITQMAAPRGEYYPNDFIPYKNFAESGLFTQKPDYYDGDDLVLTMQKGTGVKFSEVKAAWNEKSSNEDGKEMDEWHVIFDGIFMVAYLRTKFPDTVIVPDVSKGSFGRLGYTTQLANKEFGDFVKLDHPTFNTHFTMYAKDAKKTRSLITKDFMDKAVEATLSIDQPIFISFKGKKMFIAIHFSKPLFEINPYTSKLTKPDKPYEFFREMEFVATIATTLKTAKDEKAKEQAMPTLAEMFELFDGGGDLGGMF